jgi:gliding motility-associated-like protein
MAALVPYSKSFQGGLCEQIEVRLKSPMESGKEYCVSFFVRSVTGQPTFGVCIQEITATLTKDTLKRIDAMPATYLPKPQVINRNGIIKDTVNWTRITGSFIATGGEKFLTIYGYFPEDSVSVFSYNPSSNHAYYFVDDVAVWDCSTPVYEADAGDNQLVCVGDKIQGGTHDYTDYQYYWFEKGNLQDTLASIARPEFTPNKTTEYVLQVIDFKYDKTWDTVLVEIDEHCIRFGKIPNVFTPNGDGYNDRFVPQHPDDVSYEISIFNRWGKQVFSGDQDHTWDGTINSQKAAAGTYFYVIKATHQSGEARQDFSGSVTLLY